jgi:hypothetical protein
VVGNSNDHFLCPCSRASRINSSNDPNIPADATCDETSLDCASISANDASVPYDSDPKSRRFASGDGVSGMEERYVVRSGAGSSEARPGASNHVAAVVPLD